MGSGWRLGRQRPPDRCKRRMNSHIVNCLERQPEPTHRPTTPARRRMPRRAGAKPRYIYGWLTVVVGTGESGRRHEDRLITARRPAVMVGSLVAEMAARCRAEPGDLCAAIRMELPACRCPVLPIEGVYMGRVLPRQMACLLRVQPVQAVFPLYLPRGRLGGDLSRAEARYSARSASAGLSRAAARPGQNATALAMTIAASVMRSTGRQCRAEAKPDAAADRGDPGRGRCGRRRRARQQRRVGDPAGTGPP
jgi:hypothetical protein